MERKKYLTRREAAEYLGLAAGYLGNLATRGLGPGYIKLGRKVLYPVEELERWIEQNGRRVRTRG